MGKFGLISLALLSLQTLLVRAEDAAATTPKEAIVEDKDAPSLDVDISTTFPDSEIFGVKLVNGLPTNALVKFTNNEPDPVTVDVIGASLWTLSEPSQNVRNLTMKRYNVEVAANSEKTLTYGFATEMLPQELSLNIAAMVAKKDGFLFTVPAYNGTITVVEPDMSIFDPQVIFLYFFVSATFVGASYFLYTLWIAPYFPQKRKPVKSHDRAKKASRQQAGVDSGDQVSDSPAVAKTYDAEWIPAHHIHRPEARKVKSGSGRSKNRG
ncbi:translocon-associated protein [Coccidioides immitis RS]|uniref:Translocon-associated protein n=4 Tax=Coccidioides immitis TaxID=5501 RepID=J3KA41_COCIM|nr:translocon-associated protein [Coccidioides immitis RS]KMP02445.1 hypothetical protein CIRG_10268 [Coccidioides immitis RMSCC 2394]KMU76713.1 hypothetical protein CISG_05856 [Coccidioides immitis RMSCC 3703]KMU88786.1 hypothetical protein CIHG_06454 [Coccidioides immitis H538.4]TPX26538.1 hypothetical protein DIZ76_012000 [Coccidioides immitis]EAS31848.3 translocon-associated protein [Coccidioides immitis RS]